MTTTLTCTEIKQQYDSITRETVALCDQMSAIDEARDLKRAEKKALALIKKYLKLVDNSESDVFETVLVQLYPRVNTVSDKDVYGYRRLTTKSNSYKFYDPNLAEIHRKAFNYIASADINGYWKVGENSGSYHFYYPSTKELSRPFTKIGSHDDYGYWGVEDKKDTYHLYNPQSKELKGEFILDPSLTQYGFWLCVKSDDLQYLYKPSTDTSSPGFTKVDTSDSNFIWKVKSEDGNWKFFEPLFENLIAEDFVSISSKNENGYWAVQEKSGEWRFYNPLINKKSRAYYKIQYDTFQEKWYTFSGEIISSDKSLANLINQ